MILKLAMKHQGMELYNVLINCDLGMTLTYFTARSTLGKSGTMSFNGGNLLGISKWTEDLCLYL